MFVLFCQRKFVFLMDVIFSKPEVGPICHCAKCKRKGINSSLHRHHIIARQIPSTHNTPSMMDQCMGSSWASPSVSAVCNRCATSSKPRLDPSKAQRAAPGTVDPEN
jgi:hypothetical protein